MQLSPAIGSGTGPRYDLGLIGNSFGGLDQSEVVANDGFEFPLAVWLARCLNAFQYIQLELHNREQ